MAGNTVKEQLELAIALIPKEFLQTVYMVFASGAIAIVFGLFLAILLVLTRPTGIKQSRRLYLILELLVNIGRSIPFAILIVAMIPITRWIVGTSIGTTATIVPLTIAAIPFVARIFENSFTEVKTELIEAALVMGASTRQIIEKVYLPEALPSLIQGSTLTIVNLVGYSAMAGLVGGGGLGKIAIQYGYQRFNGFLMVLTLIILVLFVQIVQMIGNWTYHSILRKRGLA